MSIRYVRVRDRDTGHEYDVLEQNVDPEAHTRVKRYPVTSRPRPPKPFIGKDGKPAAPRRK